jgi:hypothetical protein
MVVYLTINLINGKKYIGKDSNNNPNYLGSGVYLSKAIKKYGKENFKKIILENVDNDLQLNEREEYWINKFNAHKSKEFYNLTEKGKGWVKNKKRKNIKHLQSKINQYDFQGNLIKKWDSMDEANKMLGLPKGAISNVCRKKELRNGKGKYQSAGGYVWSYEGEEPNFSFNRFSKKRPVNQYDVQNNFIKRWSSMKEVIKKLNLDRSMLSKAIKKEKVYKNYIWKYEFI